MAFAIRTLLAAANLSRHTKTTDPLKGNCGFDFTRHQVSWNTAWRSLRRAAAKAIVDSAKHEKRDLAQEELESVRAFQRLRFHDMRHTFVTLMAERNVPLSVVQSMVGHMSKEMVRHYTHISNNSARKAVELLDKPSDVGNFVGSVKHQENRWH